MNPYWFTIILYFLKYWSWPVLIFVLFLIFRNPIKIILSNLTGIKIGSFSADIDQTSSLTTEAFSNTQTINTQRFSKGSVSLVGMVISSWNSVEEALQAAVERKGLADNKNHTMPFRNIQILASANLLTPEQVTALKAGRNLRNKIVHDNHAAEKLKRSDVDKYIATNNIVIVSLNSL
ncbi:hypothetical protein [Levilactobacillus brevis]|uniref:hypothetical protein n=1 Tax=Levilactobacillus brevis TaxID=1580 RepID=UPI000BEACADB|nr:hypothetical protein [Levilactobacillus brevis]STX19335.1 Uncharacterised protein [Levilactobacillus brevis]